MPLNDEQKISEIIREHVDSFEFRRPCIIKGHESLTSDEISYDQAINDEISKQILDSELHKTIESLKEFGMAAHYVDITSRGIHIRPINPNSIHAAMTAVIGGLKHDIVIVDDEYQPKYIDTTLEHEKPFLIAGNPYRTRKYVNAEPSTLIEKIKIPILEEVKKNHPHGWYRKFEKKRF